MRADSSAERSKGYAEALPLVEWVRYFEIQADLIDRRKWYAHWERESARSKERWRKFKASREAWYLERLGPVEFWGRRLQWAIAKDRPAAAARAAVELRAALRGEAG